MVTAYVIVTGVAVALTALSGLAALVHFTPIVPAMARVGVPESWLTFPIGTLKVAGALGLLLGLAGVPLIGTAAAIGLVLYFVCAIYTHVRAGDYSTQLLQDITDILRMEMPHIATLLTVERVQAAVQRYLEKASPNRRMGFDLFAP